MGPVSGAPYSKRRKLVRPELQSIETRNRQLFLPLRVPYLTHVGPTRIIVTESVGLGPSCCENHAGLLNALKAWKAHLWGMSPQRMCNVFARSVVVILERVGKTSDTQVREKKLS